MEKIVLRTQLEVPVDDLPFFIMCNTPFRIYKYIEKKCKEKFL